MIFCAVLIFFSKLFLSSIFFSECQTVLIQIRPDKTFVGPDLGSNCLQRLSVDDTSRRRVKSRTSIKNEHFTSSIKTTTNKCLMLLVHV